MRTTDCDRLECRCALDVCQQATAWGAPCVSWVHDERDVLGDNILDWVSPVGWERDRSVYEGRPARMLASTPVVELCSMSFDLVFQRFEGAARLAGETDAAKAYLAPMVKERDRFCGRIGTVDGEADVYGIERLATAA